MPMPSLPKRKDEVFRTAHSWIIHGKCGHNLGVDRVHNTWPKLSLIKFISLPCLSSIHSLSSRSCLVAHQPAINGSAWPKCFELHCDSKAVT